MEERRHVTRTAVGVWLLMPIDGGLPTRGMWDGRVVTIVAEDLGSYLSLDLGVWGFGFCYRGLRRLFSILIRLTKVSRRLGLGKAPLMAMLSSLGWCVLAGGGCVETLELTEQT
jgi:hypothetical protein